MGIPTLIKTLTASNSASLAFVDGASDVTLDSTYDEYMFVFTDIGPATDGAVFSFQVNATDDAGGGYDTAEITTTAWSTYLLEDGSASAMAYIGAHDAADSTGYITISHDLGNASDESTAGIFHLFSPSSTTYLKHFQSRFFASGSGDQKAQQNFTSGYIKDVTAIDEISFKMDTGNFDGVIQLFGIA